MPTLQIGVPAGLGTLYSVRYEDWYAIDFRNGLVLNMQLPPTITQYIPTWPDLVNACTAWRDTTFPGLITNAVTMSQFANNAWQTIESLSSDVTTLPPGDPVPDSVSFTITAHLQALAQSASELASASAGLQQEIVAFVAANQAAAPAIQASVSAADQEVALFASGWVNGAYWSPDAAIATVQQAWASVVSQFTATPGAQVPVMTGSQLASDLQSAAAEWDTLAIAASQFPKQVAPPANQPQQHW